MRSSGYRYLSLQTGWRWMFNRVIPRSRDEFHSLSVEDKARNESFGVEGKNSSRTVSEFKKCKFDFSRDNEEVVNRKPIFCPPPRHVSPSSSLAPSWDHLRRGRVVIYFNARLWTVIHSESLPTYSSIVPHPGSKLPNQRPHRLNSVWRFRPTFSLSPR